MNERTALIYVIQFERGLCALDFGYDHWDDVPTTKLSQFVYDIHQPEAMPQGVAGRAKPLKDVYVPEGEYTLDGEHWMHFRYQAEGTAPWKWPQVMEYKGRKYKFTGYNSDTMYVFYKGVEHVATEVK